LIGTINEEPPFDENYMARKPFLHEGMWVLEFKESFTTWIEDKYASLFLILGYILFFLPLSGESALLVQHCREQTFLTEQVINFLPTRTALVRKAMEEYLKRVGGEPSRRIHSI